MSSFAVVGLGNPLRGDDGVGIVLIERLRECSVKLPRGVEILDGGTGGLGLVHVFSRFETIIVVDAVDFGGKPGAYRFFKLDEVESFSSDNVLSSHEDDFLKVLSFFKKLDSSPKKVFVFGVQPKSVSYGMKLSSEVEERVGFLVDELIKKVTSVFS
ncbi:MAG: hydrogenase maturation protease [Thermoplasmata archaeon]|nr:hydrogenase maturation protease [Thermoplasmata archaeon]RLF28362.1 MAG: hypothetical protein DRN01_00030 [Thermoplasmata archaeon]